ncbi:cold-regulated protein 27 isoform X1 [Vigna angularis]|uniref:cold-regulated protein 27 isoform X1 n=1 Tax=Phaseolus angularis TaxID=3914 RepID=UPI000809BC14|nr:cold-regulated protein 27 isoform X1 [Vigna angularis]XP_052735989.1 cold-regulated protein 27 isoform X1 [Vigna angularis]XP_052735990.1 cold-regulated protein 27 isoform X1 [Vigna angularis]XP_052735992.1 cold-regulated protein 27 isoform X1 [Vigna angularis]
MTRVKAQTTVFPFCSPSLPLSLLLFIHFLHLPIPIANKNITHKHTYKMNNNFRVTRTPEETPTTSSTFLNSHNNPIQGIREIDSTMAAEWTDEKHSMYIKSIEASFVNQLYDSKQMRASFPCKGTSCDPATTSGQFKVLRGGCWQKINFERPQTSRINQCHDLTENPWIQHYRSSSKQRNTVAPSLQESVSTSNKVVDLGQRKGIPSGSGHLHLCESRVCHKDMLSSDTEMSGQNFVDDEVKGKKQNKKSKVKRQRSLTDAKDNDQLRPFAQLHNRLALQTGRITLLRQNLHFL